MVIIVVRKLLDFAFSRHDLKILDDIMPESTKRKREEEKELIKKGNEGDASSPQGLLPNASSGNVSIPLANGNILKIPVDKIGKSEKETQESINITEQLKKSDAWRSINMEKNGNAKKTTQQNGHKKNRGTKKDAKTEDEQHRLSTMREEDDEEDCGITIKVDAPTPIPSSSGSPEDQKGNSETPV